ncbi:MAG: 2-oxoglutarate oxidoreductase, beta subunit [Candidatus Ozemobacter sibiricus]|jgi:pyruvate/2-oxoacid:ferredoxin oxidoreductase beta subunit/Pyruvate/2-oxoacid:ferredoxin oxidoreductase gamma subunit|uniref:2-oxoglutarate oxidoreductase, beta subunit n=1 Tax=Candidatus Ozemobacter sibiricus TaxID=2268124 RepID=A0A367ZVA6_9BACT|nr:MAG: 2-oxoglutarate oxidoreductase, beta subunit [Candidatus Ozemobacter sibiricus]
MSTPDTVVQAPPASDTAPAFLRTDHLPFCKGCGHNIVAINTEKALHKVAGLSPLDVVVVSDIGCIGIIDQQYASHTIHGLHGRSTALGVGVSLGVHPPGKKILVYIGDGGATIGLPHILEAADRNVDMTVLVHNNMLYGMTGGQPSGLTPVGFKTASTPDGKITPGFDLCRLAHVAGAIRVQRLIGIGDFSDDLAEAFRTPGFSLVEIIEICPSYGVKYNPGRKPADIARENGFEPVVLTNPPRPIHSRPARLDRPSLLNDDLVVPHRDVSNLPRKYSIILAGSAGEGVQAAGELLAEAGIACGLSVTKKGSYPVTVGVGFSLIEVNLKNRPINYTGIETPDAIVITSLDGLRKVESQIRTMQSGVLLIDASLPKPASPGVVVISADLRTPMGTRNVSLYSLGLLLAKTSLLPLSAYLDAIRHRFGDKVDLARLQALLTT